MNKCCCLILNYNDSETTIRLLQLIYAYSSIDQILVVDNNSTDESFSQIAQYEDSRITVIRSEKNGGYGYGNNYGIRYARENLGCSEILLANPDVVFSNDFVAELLETMRTYKDAAIVAGIQHDVYDKEITEKAWKIPTAFRYAFTFTQKSMKLAQTHYSEELFRNHKILLVDCVPGALLLINPVIFEKLGGYDENIFLYCEEDIIGQKVKAGGYKTLLVCHVSYIHQHGVSIEKSISSKLKQRKMINHNKLYFMKKYLQANLFEMLIARIISRLDILFLRARDLL